MTISASIGAKGDAQDQENAGENADTQQRQSLIRALCALELASIFDLIPLRQFHRPADALLDVLDSALKVASLDVTLNYDPCQEMH